MIDFRVNFGKAFKIFILKHECCGLIHFIYIGLMKNQLGQVVQEGVFSENYPIEIGPFLCVKSGVSIGLYFPDSVNSNFTWQNRVDAFQKIFSGFHPLEIKVTNLMLSVNSGVSPSASHDRDGLSKECGKGVFDTFLHSKGIVLNLPAVKRCAFVAQIQKISFYPTHCGSKDTIPNQFRSRFLGILGNPTGRLFLCPKFKLS